MKLITSLILCLLPPMMIMAQTDEDLIEIYKAIEIDSITVIASKKGFDIEDFIDLAINDTSFYAAFQNLRMADYPFKSEAAFYDKKGKVIASYSNNARQIIDSAGCRTMTIDQENTSGKLYKRNDYRYWTMRMFDRAFFTRGQICRSTTVSSSANTKHKNSIQKYYGELKKLIFFPDQKINVPMIGQRTQIYSASMRPHYQFSVRSAVHASGTECYVFSAELKPAYITLSKKRKTIIKYLHLYFSKEDFQVMGKSYHLDYNSGVYSFDVKMDMQLKQNQGQYYPALVDYRGEWNVPFKKRERSTFMLVVSDQIKW